MEFRRDRWLRFQEHQRHSADGNNPNQHPAKHDQSLSIHFIPLVWVSLVGSHTILRTGHGVEHLVSSTCDRRKIAAKAITRLAKKHRRSPGGTALAS
jgi:hypothetical protein